MSIYSYDESKYGAEKTIATVGWLRKAVVDAGFASVEAVESAIEYLGEQLKINEGIEISDEMELMKYHSMVFIYQLYKYYKANPMNADEVKATINIYNTYNIENVETKKDGFGLKVIAIAIILTSLNTFTGQVATDIYSELKEKVLEYSGSVSFDELIQRDEIILIYSDDDAGADSKEYLVSDTQIELIRELDDWIQVYYVCDGEMGFGYLKK